MSVYLKRRAAQTGTYVPELASRPTLNGPPRRTALWLHHRLRFHRPALQPRPLRRRCRHQWLSPGPQHRPYQSRHRSRRQ